MLRAFGMLGLIVLAWSAAVGDAAGSAVTLQSGETLAAFAEKRYGSRHYQLPLAKLNKLDPKSRPTADIKAPDLKAMVLSEGLSRAVEDQIDRVMSARYQFMRVRADLIKSMESGPAHRPAQVPLDVQRALREAAAELEDAGRVMAKKAVYAESAVRVRQRLGQCAKNLRALADGSRSRELEDSIHLLMAQAFVRLISWGRLEDG